MTSETRFRIGLSILLLAFGLLVAKNVFGQVKLDVAPRLAITNPYKATTFRVRFRIEPHPDNREYAYFASCGGEEISSIRKIEYVTYTFFENLIVLNRCLFQVCISRLGLKNPICVRQEVGTGGG